MQVNETPILDQSDNETGCCARFKPDGWNDQTFHFENKKFVRTVLSFSQASLEFAQEIRSDCLELLTSKP